MFDVAYTSVLKRAIKTLWLALEQMDQMWIPVHNTWRLNERHYGALQGLNKAETAAQHGMEQTHIWRRSYDMPPPALTPDDPRHPTPRPALRGTQARRSAAHRVPEGHRRALPALLARDHRPGGRSGPARPHRRARQQSARARSSTSTTSRTTEIVELNVPTGIPLVYELNDDLTPIRSYYLGDPEAMKEGRQAVANQLKK